MQVHKETIDKVPNSAPTRGNIEIEIYGMEGIPEEDIKAHEARGDDDDDGRRDNSDSPAVPTPPLQAGPQLPAGMAGMPVVRPGAPFMPGPGMGWGGPGVMPGMPGMPGMMPQQMQFPGGHAAGLMQPQQPLFPSAANTDGKPTFPAYSDDAEKPALIATTGVNTKIIHPPEDISLEEHRSSLPKYRPPPPPVPPAPSPVMEQQPQVMILQAGQPMINLAPQMDPRQFYPAVSSMGMSLPQHYFPTVSSMSSIGQPQPQYFPTVSSISAMMPRPTLVQGMQGIPVSVQGIPGHPLQGLQGHPMQGLPAHLQGLQGHPFQGVPQGMIQAMPNASMPSIMMSQPQLFAQRPQMISLPGQQQAMVPGPLVLGGVNQMGGHLGMGLIQHGSPFGLLGGLGIPRFR
ncbi:collagen alpha-1(VIII) chain isoform X3 [Eurytemora carolleeae]|uniref:collagen alpha-1(VIII) chain isoform X3 n=1 Tax=Eurytemora carolleeae TaxID=1294199 RepID=UPI000C75BDD0|nr:collagen alpha-1(VIII) chain isoform X3 [Eurytemora carolleeae]|eukprot:XP_023334674.1 collagen alpha-1(VIII) chain-like isoform X3 [Eurytemora affinis]